jgi:hypothetical protein
LICHALVSGPVGAPYTLKSRVVNVIPPRSIIATWQPTFTLFSHAVTAPVFPYWKQPPEGPLGPMIVLL